MAFIAKMNSMPTLDASVRSKNFKEVALGYSANVAIEEAKRCLNCKNKPCVTGCPANIDIPGFISHVKNNDFDKAFEVISQSSCLPAVCGRVCPQESQCESKCTMGVKFEPVGIGRLERFVADYHNSKDSDNEQKAKQVQPNGIKIAIIGSGPSGLSCAGDLVREGFEVSIYEALHLPGGVLSYGIPEFRLPKRIIRKEVDALISQGVKLKTNVVIGKTLDIDDLFEMGYKAIYVSTGAGLPKFMNIPGESLKGVYSANEFLT
ncbi:MAG: FAD-dependent oxidoreductase, partial [Saccharofermentanales bacterium]